MVAIQLYNAMQQEGDRGSNYDAQEEHCKECEVTKRMDGPETQAMLGHPLTLMMARMRSFSSTAATSLAAALPAAALLVLMNAILRPSSSSASRYSSSTWCIGCSVS